MVRYYLDTSIWIDFYDDRKDSSKDLGKYAFDLLIKIYSSNGRIIVSSVLLHELSSHYTLDQIRGFTVLFRNIIERAEYTEKQEEEAKRIAKERSVPKGDAFHAILARDNNAVLVSRDRHFQLLKDICKFVMPEDVI